MLCLQITYANSTIRAIYNRGQNALEHSCNLTIYLCFRLLNFEKKRWFPGKNSLQLIGAGPLPIPAGSSFQHCMGGWSQVRQEKLKSRLRCAQKRQKCKFVTRRLSMIVSLMCQRLKWKEWQWRNEKESVSHIFLPRPPPPPHHQLSA